MRKEDMNPVEARFWKFLRENPFCSTYSCFAASIWGRNIPEDKLKKFFKNLVDKEDLIGEDLSMVLRNLYYLNQEAVYLDRIPKKLTQEEVDWFKIRGDEYMAYLSPWLKKEFINTHLDIH